MSRSISNVRSCVRVVVQSIVSVNMDTLFNVQEFVKDVTVARLKKLLKAQLKEVASHFGADISKCTRKAEILEAVLVQLNLEDVEHEVIGQAGVDVNLSEDSARQDHGSAGKMVNTGSVDSQIKLASIELEKERVKMESLKLQIQLNQWSGAPQGGSRGVQGNTPRGPDISKMASCEPQFSEEDIDSFFASFERMARNLEWEYRYWPMVVQQKLMGRAQSVVCALSDDEANDYWSVKEAVLRAYELVPEAYRQKFRSCRRLPGQTFVEFQREKEILFDRWYRSLKIKQTYANLREVVLMEEFKKSAPPDVRSYLEDQGVQVLRSAAVTADSYELTHSRKIPPYRRKFDSPKNQHEPWRQSGYSERGGRSNTDMKRDKSKSPVPQRREVTCFHCGRKGHIMSECWQLKEKEKMKENSQKKETHGFLRPEVGDDSDFFDDRYSQFVSYGKVDFEDSVGIEVVILRDTGATQTLMAIDPQSLPAGSFTGRHILIYDVNGGTQSVPLYKTRLSCDLIAGEVIIGVVPSLPMKGITLLLGNDLAGGQVTVTKKPVLVDETERLEDEFPGIFPACVVTRAQARHKRSLMEGDQVSLGETFFGSLDEDKIADCQESLFGKSALIEAQQVDEELLKLRQTALTVNESESVPECYYVKSEVLMRKWRPPDRPADEDWAVVHQIVVPPPYRSEILRLAHEVPMAGHLGVRKTLSKIMAHFFWPGIRSDVAAFCRSCHTCQMVGKPQHVIKPAPLTFLAKFRDKNQRLFRWSLILQPFALKMLRMLRERTM